MAATVNGTPSQASGNAVTSLSWSHTLAGSDIGFCLLVGDESNVDACTIGGTTVTKFDQTTGPASNATVSIWYATAGADGLTTGAKTVSLTNFFTENMQAVGVTVNGADQDANIFAAAESTIGTGTGTSSSRATSNSATGELVLSVICFPTSANATPSGTGHVELVADINGSVIQTAFGQKPGASGTTTDWTLSSSVGWAHANISIDAAPGATVNPTGVSSTTGKGTVTPATSKTLSGVSSTTGKGTVTPALTKNLTGVQAAGAVNFMGPVIGRAITGPSATGAVGLTAAFDDKLITGASATGAISTPSVAVSRAGTGAAATGQTGTPTAALTLSLTGVQAAGAVGSMLAEGEAPVQITGVATAGAVGSVNPAVSAVNGRSHTDLSVRQWLEVLYTREQEERQRKLELANQKKAVLQPRKARKLVRQAIEEDQYLLTDTAVMRLAAQQEGLRAALARLQNSFSIQSAQLSEARARREDDDDLLLLSAIL